MHILSLLIFLLSIPTLLLGMIVPRVFNRFFKQGATRKKIAKIFGAIMAGALIMSAVTAPPLDQQAQQEDIEGSRNQETELDKVSENSKIIARIIRVVDGDTVSVEIEGKSETIRIIGINTPETVDPRKPVECFGQEASARAQALLDNQTVTLEADATQGERDKYDRLLRYVFLPDGSDFAIQMISEGYAYEYTYSTPYKYQQDYKTSQSEAETAKRGLWADGACSNATGNSDTPQETSTEADTSPQDLKTAPTSTLETDTEPMATPSANAAPAPTVSDPTPESNTSTTASCSCSTNSFNCGDFTTHDQAQAVYECCMNQVGYDVHQIDGSDNDGQACESLP